jgi:CubicO group peptidase (beta-lactamase class C family)
VDEIMKALRIGVARFRVAAALAFILIAIALGIGRAEQVRPNPSGFSSEALARISAYMRHEVTSGKIPGAVLLIQQHGRPVLFDSYGVRDIDSNRPMTTDTIFRLYSMSKAVTSVAAMMLVDDGKLSLDDPLSKYIPAFANVKVGVERRDDKTNTVLVYEPLARPITIEDLLRHTSGLTYGFYGDGPVQKMYATSGLFGGDFDNALFAERIAKLPMPAPTCARQSQGRSRCFRLENRIGRGRFLSPVRCDRMSSARRFRLSGNARPRACRH